MKKSALVLAAALATAAPLTSQAELTEGESPLQALSPELARGVGDLVVQTLADAGAAGLDFNDSEALRSMAELGDALPDKMAESPEMAGALNEALLADKDFNPNTFGTLPAAERLRILKKAGDLARQKQAAMPGNQSTAKPLPLGIDASAMDPSVRPQDDLFRYVNGTWIKNFKMPADKSIYRIFEKLNDENEKAINDLIQGFAAEKDGSDPNKRKIADFHKSYMDTETVDARGFSPIAADLEKIGAIQDKAELPGLFAWARTHGIPTPVWLYVEPDRKNPAAYITYLTQAQAGLGLPDRSFYFKQDEESAEIRAKYIDYAAKLFALAGEAEPEKKARAVFELEKALAKHHWTMARKRDVLKKYNKVSISELGTLGQGFDWAVHLSQSHLRPEETAVVVKQPSYLMGFAREIRRQSLEDWKLYMKLRVLASAAPFLPDPFVQAHFDFNGRAVSGISELEPRWKRGVQLVNDMAGGLVGPFYAQKFFPESSKKHMGAMVEHLRSSCASLIRGISWMSEETKEQALEKLAKMIVKIGYPDRWRDYSRLDVKADDLLGNVRRAVILDYEDMLAKLGRPVDRSEWTVMHPQTLNAEFNPVLNAMTFPAAIVQAPMFDPSVDDAANYGSIGAIIGHEMSHGFDDQGARSDGDGRLRNWWAQKDKAAFEARGQALARQFDAYEPLPGKHIDGQLTLGENIADLIGLTIAFRAYRLSLAGAPAPVIDGFTGEQRFFMGFAQTWRSSALDQEKLRRLVIDPHSPEEYRVNGIPRNMPEFYEAFGVKEGDALYLPKDRRVSIW